MASYCMGASLDFHVTGMVAIPLTPDSISTHSLQNLLPSTIYLNPFLPACFATNMSVFCMLEENFPFILRSLEAPQTFRLLDWGIHSLHPQLPFHPHSLLDPLWSPSLPVCTKTDLQSLNRKISSLVFFSVLTLVTSENGYPPFAYLFTPNLL